MRTRFSARLSRLEQAVIVAPDNQRHEERLRRQTEAKRELARNPDLAVVIESDASPLAWRSIQITLAQARGDFLTAERLWQEHYRTPQAPADAPDPFIWELNWVADMIGRTIDDVDAAVLEAGRRRKAPAVPSRRR